LKFRDILKEGMALLHWKPDGEKEKAIHDWCFGAGRKSKEIPLLNNYIRARDLAKNGDEAGFKKELADHDHKIPLTSLMGLLSNFGLHMALDSGKPYRDYAVAAASPIETVLRLREWGAWLDDGQIDIIAKKVTGAKGLDIPFYKVVNAYLAVPKELKARIFDPIYVPLMKRFSNQMAQFIPKGTQVVLMQPNCFVNIMSLLFLATVSYERSTRVLLLGEKIDEHDDKTVLSYGKLKKVLLEDSSAIQNFFLKEFGAQALRNEWRFDANVAASAFDRFRTDDMLIIDMPFFFSTRILERMLPMNRVLNLGNNFGSPSEISLAVKYVPTFSVQTRRGGIWGYQRFSSTSVSSLAGFIERLEWFDRAGGENKC
jgi:hypothetical protein